MKHAFLPLFLLSAVLAQAPQPAANIRPEDLKADIAFLTSPPLAGRMSLERGSDVAIQWIASEFAKAGLSAPYNGSYLQPVELEEFHPDPAAQKLRVGSNECSFIKDFVGTFPKDGSYKGEAVFAGYGITALAYGYDDYANIDAKGKVVVMFDHEPQENDPKSIFNGIGNTRYANSRLKTINAQNHGAVAVVLVNEPNRKHPSNLDRLKRIPGFEQRLVKFPSQSLVDSEVKIPLFTVSDEVGESILKLTGKSGKELQAAIDSDLKPRSQPLKTTIELVVKNADYRRAMSANVIGVLEGTDPQLKSEAVVYSGHYDHDGVRDGKMYPGADDNASGTVGVVELAKAFTLNRAKPKRSIVFAVFAAEERGLLGSYYYVAHPLFPMNKTVAVVNFDMIGRNETPSAQTNGLRQIDPDTSNELGLIGTIYSPDYRQAVEQRNKAVGLNLNYTWDQDAALNVFQRSDQFPFSLKDVPAMWWFTGFHPDYHQPTDTVEKINFPKMTKILELAYRTGWYWADGGTPPKFHARVSQ
jgi:Zn-dependent M28 family amino/carboxypeptidase